MSTVTIPVLPVLSEGPRRKRFTRHQVERMIDSGVFDGQRFELIDGELIDKMGQNPPHSYSVQLVMNWLITLFKNSVRVVNAK